MDKPIKRVGKGGIVYCARCGQATTRLEATLRKFNTGYSGCCNDNLLKRPPINRCPPKNIQEPFGSLGRANRERRR